MHLQWLALATLVAESTTLVLGAVTTGKARLDKNSNTYLSRATVKCTSKQYLKSGKCISCTTFDKDAKSCNTYGVTACSTKFLTSTKKCVSSCPAGTYGNTSTKKCASCVSLFPGSSTCTATKATKCSTGRFLSQGSCLKSCPSSTYANTATSACSPCSSLFSNSVTCTTKAATSCRSGKLLIKGACEEPLKCDSTRYLNKLTNKCIACSSIFPYSIRCTANEALACSSTRVLRDGECKAVPKCSGATFLDVKKNVCVACPDKFAATCSATAVLTCSTGYKLVENRCVVKAADDCDQGLVFVPRRQTCEVKEVCPPGAWGWVSYGNFCEECTDDFAVSCDDRVILACITGYKVVDNVCVAKAVDECDEGLVFVPERQTCEVKEVCPPGVWGWVSYGNFCEECTDEFALSCDDRVILTCVAGYKVVDNVCVPKAVDECDEGLVWVPGRQNCQVKMECPEGPWAYVSFGNYCSECPDEHAATCSETEILTCYEGYEVVNDQCAEINPGPITSCDPNSVLINGACEPVRYCGGNAYPDPDTNLCLFCADPNAITCDRAGAINCSRGYQLTNRACIEITSCPDGFLLINKACVFKEECDTAMYLNEATNKCVYCKDRWASSCSATQVFKCYSPYKVVNNACVKV